MTTNHTRIAALVGTLGLGSACLTSDHEAADLGLQVLTEARQAALTLSPEARQATPVTTGVRLVNRSQVRTWRDIWRASWRVAVSWYPYEVASSLRGHPACASASSAEVGRLVEDIVGSFESGNEGDSARLLGAFVERTRCLTRPALRALDLSLGWFLHGETEESPFEGLAPVLRGAANVSMLVFDQLAYAGPSWIAALAARHPERFRAGLGNDSTGPAARLWLLESGASTLIAVDGAAHAERLARVLGKPEIFQGTACTLLGILRSPDDSPGRCSAQNGGSGGPSSSSGGGREGGGGVGAVPLPVSAGAACALSAVSTNSPSAQVRCLDRAAGGLRPSLSELLSGPPLSSHGVLDGMCALRDEAGEDDAEEDLDEDEDTDEDDEQSWLHDMKDTWDDVLHKGKEVVDDVVVGILDVACDLTGCLPPVIDELSELASEDGAEAAQTVLETMMDQRRKEEIFMSNDGNQAEQWKSWKEKTNKEKLDHFKQKGNQRTSLDPGGSPSNDCSGASNAARRARKVFDCASQGAAVGAPSSSTPFDPVELATNQRLPSCAGQEGSTVAAASTAQCRIARCAPGQACACGDEKSAETSASSGAGTRPGIKPIDPVQDPAPLPRTGTPLPPRPQPR